VTGSGTDWTVTATITGPGGTVVGTYTGSPIDNNGSGELVLSELADEMRNAFASVSPVMDDVSVSVNGNTLSVTSDVNTVLYSVPSGGTDLLGMISDYVYMRTRPASTTDALGILGSFRIQVGSQGTQVMSKYVGANVNGAGFTEGDILGPGTAGETYTFRIGVDDYEANITVAWNDTTQLWEMSCDAVVTPATPVTSATNFFTVSDIANYLGTVLPTTGTSALEVGRGSSPNGQFYLKSTDNHLISIADVKGDLAAKMGMVNPNPVITIDIEETDSLETIRNKINEKYQEEYGLTAPEQWVHASLAQASDQSWYLTIASDVPGEAQRITLMGDESGNIQPLLRLGLLNTVEVGSGQYRYVTAISQKAEDASFTFNGVRYLSSDNTFSQARRIPSSTSRYDYSASTLETVSEGLWLELKSVGQTAITVRHHVQDGTIKGMEDIRDGLIQDLKGGLDELAWELVNNFNAYQYAGYGIGDALNTTGTAFFEPLTTKAGAASRLGVSSAISGNVNLIGAAMGQLDASGRAIYGTSAGSGSGSNAARMTAMQYGQLLAGGTASFGEYYNGYLSKIGSEAGRAALMSRTQSNLVANIDEQRQAVMGVNIDEEMLDLLKWNTAYNAMARYVTTIDEMLDRIINGFGLVGR
ncbi:MAG: hypothetical protein LBR61_13935, partial [Synergistaceae bacterium]|nr:hypothetical protein [Synergistaceae bacterium]